jgi:threonine aldolase
MQDDGVLLTPFGPRTIRATTHRDVSDDDIEAALEAFERRFG